MPAPVHYASDRRALVMHLSVPAEGGLRSIAGDVAARIAEHLGFAAAEARTVADLVERLASRLGNGGPPGRAISFEFRDADGELVIAGRCNGETSEVRHPLPA